MNLQHVGFKVFIDGDLATEWEKFINVFHEWVAAQSMPEMMIDVADYRHVPNGPGVVMVGHDADYYMDNTDGKPGLRYVCKRELSGTNADRIQQAFQAASSACSRLEAEFPELGFSRTHFELTLNDRALVPNNDATRAGLASELPAILETALSTNDAELTYQEDNRRLAGATIQLSSPVEFVAS